MEKQLSDVSIQMYTIESIARQNKAITALFKLQTYYGTTGDTLHFHTFFGKYGHDYYALRNSIMLSCLPQV